MPNMMLWLLGMEWRSLRRHSIIVSLFVLFFRSSSSSSCKTFLSRIIKFILRSLCFFMSFSSHESRGGIIRSAAGNSVSPESACRAEIIQESPVYFSRPGSHLTRFVLDFRQAEKNKSSGILAGRRKNQHKTNPKQTDKAKAALEQSVVLVIRAHT